MTALLRILFDANVWVSAYLFPRSVPGSTIDLVRDGFVQSIISAPLVEQAYGALLRLRYGEAAADEARAEMRALSDLVVPTVRLAVITAKESDNRVLECAVAGNANVIVTGDRKHLLPLRSYAGIPIVSPADFLRSR